MTARLLTTLSLSLFLGLTHCSSPEQHEGTSSGGGGFAGENSQALIKKSSEDLGRMLRTLNPKALKNLPQGWTKDKLADVVENIRLQENTEKRRHGKRLIMDYGTDQKGPYIAALAPFFMTYNHVAVEYEKPTTIANMVKDIHKLYLHELGHLVYNHAERYSRQEITIPQIEKQARAFAKAILKIIESDTLLCSTTNVKDWPLTFHKVFSRLKHTQTPDKEIVCAVGYASKGPNHFRPIDEFRRTCNLPKLFAKPIEHRFLISKGYGFSIYSQTVPHIPATYEQNDYLGISYDPTLQEDAKLGLQGNLYSLRFDNEAWNMFQFFDFSPTTYDKAKKSVRYNPLYDWIGLPANRARLARKSVMETLELNFTDPDNVSGEITYKGTVPREDHVNGLPHYRSFSLWIHANDQQGFKSSVFYRDDPKGYGPIYLDTLDDLRTLVKKPGTPVSGSFKVKCESYYQTIDFNKI